MNDHDPQLERVGRGRVLGTLLAQLLLATMSVCLIVVLVAVTVRLVEWIIP